MLGIKPSIRKDCFAFKETEKEKDGISWKESKCDCLNRLECARKICPFYKPAENLIRYEYRIGNIPGVGYMEK